MAFFLFPAPGRKKMASHPPLTEPMSKAHRILGSFPLSIDAPPSNRDDASSSALSDDRSVTTATSCDPDSEAGDSFDDHDVGIAKSDSGWGDESGVLPHSLRLDNHFDDEAAGTITPSILRKSRSSSTIKSWYDKTKLPLSISQQTSSSAMAKGLPNKPDRMLDLDLHSVCSLDVPTKSKNKKKPAKLDLSSLMSAPRLIRKVSHRQLGGGGEVALGLTCTKNAPIVLSPMTTMDGNLPQAPLLDASQRAPPNLTASRHDATGRRSGNQWPRTNDALSALPTLYDHYEQMSMRHVMKQCSQPDLSRSKAEPRAPRSSSKVEWQLARRPSKCFDEFHDSPPPTPQTAFHTKHMETSPLPATSTTSVSNRHTKVSKTTVRSFGSADLQQTSVLMLSDSEGDDIPDDMSPLCKRTTQATARRSPALENDVPPLVASRSRASKERSKCSEKSADKRCKSSKQASFAPTDTYMASGAWPPPTDSLRGATFLSSSIHSASAATDSSSRRTSLASNHSASSAATEQSKRSGYGIREARAVTMLPARPSSVARNDADETRQPMLDWDDSRHRQSIASSTDQLTPPLSPTSVDFYIRSARSSIDGPGSHSRLMAVSRQEEMLLSALRQKQKAMRGSAMTDLLEGIEGQEGEPSDGRRPSVTKSSRHSQRRGSRDQRPKAAQTSTAELAMIDLDLPAPQSWKSDASNSFERQFTSRTFRRRWSAAAAVPSSGKDRLSQGSSCEHLDEEVPLILDDADPSPDLSDYRDWHAAMTAGTTPAGKPSSRRDLFGNQSRRLRRGSAQSNCSPTQLRHDNFARLSGVAEEKPGDAEEEADVPRPDSPISPESFPAVPHGRVTGCSLERLSAVGSGLLAGDLAHL